MPRVASWRIPYNHRVAWKMRWEGNTYDEIGAHFGVARAVIHRHMHPNAKKLHRRRVTELELEMQELRERLELVEALGRPGRPSLRRPQP